MDIFRTSLGTLAAVHLSGARAADVRPIAISGSAQALGSIVSFSFGWLVAGLDDMFPRRCNMPDAIAADVWISAMHRVERAGPSRATSASFYRWHELHWGTPPTRDHTLDATSEVWRPLDSLLGIEGVDHRRQIPLASREVLQKKLTPRALTNIPLSQSGGYHATPARKRRYGDHYPGGSLPRD